MMDIDDAWASACKVILGGEIGDIASFEDYLTRYTSRIGCEKSCFSGGQVTIDGSRFSPGARFMSNQETQGYSVSVANTKMDLNEMKDVDSALAALRERFVYSGDIVLGNSAQVYRSNRCGNAVLVSSSYEVYDSKYVAYSSSVKLSEYVFGTCYCGESKYILANTGAYKDTRCFETILAHMSSDCYYSANLEGCSNCIFTFNQKSGSHLVGNTRLPREKYEAVKAKLLEDVRDDLTRGKRVRSIADVLNGR